MQNHKYEGQMDGLLPGGYDPRAYMAPNAKRHDVAGPNPSLNNQSQGPNLAAGVLPPRPDTASSTKSFADLSKPKYTASPAFMSQKQYEAHLKERLEQVRAQNSEVYAPLEF